eukprot:m.485675 g.485675  ORF g.485675 m.485675 type:complete len:472 (+) comp23915_c0_seq1:246-1661(+)
MSYFDRGDNDELAGDVPCMAPAPYRPLPPAPTHDSPCFGMDASPMCPSTLPTPPAHIRVVEPMDTANDMTPLRRAQHPALAALAGPTPSAPRDGAHSAPPGVSRRLVLERSQHEQQEPDALSSSPLALPLTATVTAATAAVAKAHVALPLHAEVPDSAQPLLDDVLTWMLETQFRSVPAFDFLAHVQQPCLGGQVTPAARQRLADWLLHVAESFRCEPEVFSTAMTLMDNYLARQPVALATFQTLGCCCLMVASKLISTTVLPVDTLALMMNNSVTVDQIKEQELLLVKQLEWCLDVHKPHDFLEQFLLRIPVTPPVARQLRHHAEVFVDMSYTDYDFVRFGPAVIAAAALYCAACGTGQTGLVQVGPDQHARLVGLDKFFLGEQQSALTTCIVKASEQFLSYDVNTATTAALSAPRSHHEDHQQQQQLEAESHLAVAHQIKMHDQSNPSPARVHDAAATFVSLECSEDEL